MHTKRPVGLGRNLSALLSSASLSTQVSTRPAPIPMVSIDAVRPGAYQPRRVFDGDLLQELAQSIQQQGLLQPILVRPVENDCYEILAGERRWRASQLAGLREIPVIIKSVGNLDAMVIALVENLQREDLNVLEQAKGMSRLMQEFSMTHEQVSMLVNKSRSAVTNVLRLLNLSAGVQQMLECGELTMGHARALLLLGESDQYVLAKEVVNRGLSVRETEVLAKRMKFKAPASEPSRMVQPKAHADHQEKLRTALNTQVEIKTGRREGSGKIVIHFESQKKFENIMALLSS